MVPVEFDAPFLCALRHRRWSDAKRQSRFSPRVAESAGPQKRPVAGPKKGFTLQNTKLETITPIPYDILKEGLKN